MTKSSHLQVGQEQVCVGVLLCEQSADERYGERVGHEGRGRRGDVLQPLGLLPGQGE